MIKIAKFLVSFILVVAATNVYSVPQEKKVKASSISASNSVSKDYQPQFLPNEISLTDEQLSEIKKSLTRRVVAYHDAMEAENRNYEAIQNSEKNKLAANSEHSNWKKENERNVYEQQKRHTEIIFWVVILIVLSGVLLTWYQFINESNYLSKIIKSLISENKVKNKNATDVAGMLNSNHELELNKDGIKVTTRVLGIVTLVISMGFFYIYLLYVYPISYK